MSIIVHITIYTASILILEIVIYALKFFFFQFLKDTPVAVCPCIITFRHPNSIESKGPADLVRLEEISEEEEEVGQRKGSDNATITHVLDASMRHKNPKH